ncbi:MAG: 50S ribosomal protein L6 [Caldilinea sp.]|nr:50S ribosomal protein L6 [Caldilinea sp.]MDW8439001.1 50S ribosomal protein L6 [Caldilineaceae bacterium]
MSRIGKMPIALPPKVTVSVDKGNLVTVSGPKGTLKQQFDPDMIIQVENGHVKVLRPSDQRRHRAQHGLTRALLANMVHGVSTGFTRRLEIRGVGYRVEKRGANLVLSVGKSHPVEFAPPTPDIVFEVDKDGRGFAISGIDKAAVGQLAATIRSARPPEPYQGKGIRYQGEYVRQKAGKTGKTGKTGKK